VATKARRKPGPKIGPEGRKQGVNICLTRQTRDLLHQLAAAEGVSASVWVARAVLAAATRGTGESRNQGEP
jgi:uncharacterized protein (DUF1778 family)